MGEAEDDGVSGSPSWSNAAAAQEAREGAQNGAGAGGGPLGWKKPRCTPPPGASLPSASDGDGAVEVRADETTEDGGGGGAAGGGAAGGGAEGDLCTEEEPAGSFACKDVGGGVRCRADKWPWRWLPPPPPRADETAEPMLPVPLPVGPPRRSAL